MFDTVTYMIEREKAFRSGQQIFSSHYLTGVGLRLEGFYFPPRVNVKKEAEAFRKITKVNN